MTRKSWTLALASAALAALALGCASPRKGASAEEVTRALKLKPLPEAPGGHFRETYRSATLARATPPRSSATLIYFLVRGAVVDRFHKVKSDEVIMYHAGSPAIQLLLFADGKWQERIIGPDAASGETPQSIVPAGTWMSLVLTDRAPKAWGLFGALVVPGFDYADFTAGDTRELIKQYPSAAARIRELGLGEPPVERQ